MELVLAQDRKALSSEAPTLDGDDSGFAAGTGVYFIKVGAGATTLAKRVVKMR